MAPGAALILAVTAGAACARGAQRLPPVQRERVEAAIQGALLAEVLAPRRSREDGQPALLGPEELREARERLEQAIVEEGEAWQPTECGDELLESLSIVSSQGFSLSSFAQAWRTWASSYRGRHGPGSLEALRDLSRGVPARHAGSHFIDFYGGVRIIALVPMLLNDPGPSEDDLAAAASEMSLLTHGNPKVLQASEFFMRATVHLLRMPVPIPDFGATPLDRRRRMVDALLHAAKAAGAPLHALVEEAAAEAQSRDAVLAAGGTRGALAETHSDVAVLGRLTASGAESGTEVDGGKTSYLIPAIIWFVLAYGSFADAVLANALLGGESAVRAVFLGLLLAARDGPRAVPHLWAEKLLRQELHIGRPVSSLSLQLCRSPGACHAGEGWAEELKMEGVSVSAAIVARADETAAERYRLFARIDGSELLRTPGVSEKPRDWSDEEDGEWFPPEAGSRRAACLARYFQFTSAGGRHAPLGLWPAEAMCELTGLSPVVHESFDVVLSDRLTQVIGGIVLDNEAVVKLPRLSVAPHAQPPPWASLCRHVGIVRLPEGRWELEDDGPSPYPGYGEL